jgi:hypothetical protein
VAQQHRREQCRECLFVDSSSRPPIETDFRLRAHCTQITLVKSTKSGKPAVFRAPSSHHHGMRVSHSSALFSHSNHRVHFLPNGNHNPGERRQSQLSFS